MEDHEDNKTIVASEMLSNRFEFCLVSYKRSRSLNAYSFGCGLCKEFFYKLQFNIMCLLD